MTTPKTPIINIPKEQRLSVVAKLGDDEFNFSLLLPHYNFAQKIKAKAEFLELGKAAGASVSKLFTAAKEADALSDSVFDTLQTEVDSPALYDGLKAFVLKHIIALDGLEINIRQEGSEEPEDTVRLIRRNHELFNVVFNNLWEYDSIIFAIRDRFAAYFKS